MEKTADKKLTYLAVDAQPLCHPELTGIGRVTQVLVGKLCEDKKYEITVQGTAKAGHVETTLRKNLPFLDPSHIRFFRIPSRIAYGMYMVIPFLYGAMFGKTDVFISFNYMLPAGVRGKKMVFVYDMTMKRYPETMEPVMRKVLGITLKSNCKRADRILTISQFSKNEICELLGVPEDKVRVIPLAVDKKVFHADYAKAEISGVCEKYGIREPYLLYAGTLEPRKNIVRLIEAYSRLCQRNADAPKLVITGKKGWLYDGIFDRLQELQLVDRIIFTGFVPDEDLPLLMSGARAFLFPSLYEGFGLPPLEAMACGTPVLCANTASLPEVVEDAAITVDPFDVDAISREMERLITDDALCAELREKGLRRAQEFDWVRSADALKKEISELVC